MKRVVCAISIFAILISLSIVPFASAVDEKTGISAVQAQLEEQNPNLTQEDWDMLTTAEKAALIAEAENSISVAKDNAEITNPNLTPEELALFSNASPDVVVHFDDNGRMASVEEPVNQVGIESPSIEPYVPDGMEIAPPPAMMSSREIIGSDDRVQITNVNTYPYSAIVYIQVEFSNGAKRTGTGVLVSRNIILTAGHVLYPSDIGELATTIKVTPGGVDSRFSTRTVSTSAVTLPSKWTNNFNYDYDYGYIEVPASVGNETGNFGAGYDVPIDNNTIYTYGYPDDKRAGTLWYGSGDSYRLSSRAPLKTHPR